MIAVPFLAILQLLGQSPASSDLEAFVGPQIDETSVRQICLTRASQGAGFFPFCEDMIITELGDRAFREFYYGKELGPFLTRAQASSFSKQLSRVRGVQAGSASATCLGNMLDGCLAALSSKLFVTSSATAPHWVPGEPLIEDETVSVVGYQVPVIDELRRFKVQLEKPVQISITVGRGEVVRAISFTLRAGTGSLTDLTRSVIPALLRATNVQCSAGGEAGITQNLKTIMSVDLLPGDGGMHGVKELTMCGRLVQVARFQPETKDLTTPAQLITLRFWPPEVKARK